MTGREPLLPDLPPVLEHFVRDRFADDVAARRALQAPWPGLDFHSAYQDRALWRGGARPDTRRAGRRQTFERSIEAAREWFARDRPFFPAPGTEGTLRSPYPALSDADFWVFVTLWGSEADARRELEKPMPALGGKTSVQVMAAAPRAAWWQRLTHARDPRQTVLAIHHQIINGVYS